MISHYIYIYGGYYQKIIQKLRSPYIPHKIGTTSVNLKLVWYITTGFDFIYE